MRLSFFLPLIHWLERLLKTDMRYALSGGFFLALVQVTGALVSFGLTIAFANLLPIETYGTYRYLLALYGLLMLFALPGLDTAVMRAVSQNKDESLLEGVRAKFRFGMLGGLASLLLAGYEYLLGDIYLAGALVVAGIALPAMEACGLYGNFFNGKKLFKQWATIEITTQVVSAIALVSTMLFTDNLIALVAAYFIPYIVLRVCAIWYIKAHFIKNKDRDAEMRTYGRSVTIFQIISHVGASLDQIVLYHLLGPAQVALFALATAIPNRMQSVFRISGVLSFPKFADRSAQDVLRSLPYKMVWFALGIVLLCGAYVLIAPLLFTYLFPNYLPALPYSQVIVFFTLSAISYPFSSYLLTHKKMRENYLLVISSFITKVLSLIIFVPFIGIWGAVIGVLAAPAVSTLIVFVLILRAQRGPTPPPENDD